MNAWVTSENKHCFVELQRRRRVVLYEYLKSRTYDIMAEFAASTESLSETPMYMLLPESSASEWTAYLVQETWKRKIGPKARTCSYKSDCSLTVDHLKVLAFSVRMTYAGPATETGGADVS
eukprot:10908622-Karenia_brevis.AAC.1